MPENEAARKRLKFLIEELEKIRGRHTELVSVYVPQGFNLNKVVEQLRNEQGTASNIKSKAVRKNVLAALDKILQHLKLYKQTPGNGLVIFSGNVSEKEGVDDIEIWAIEPPQPVGNRLYWCGQNFILDPLKEMIRETDIYGIIVLDTAEASIGLLSGKKVTMLKHMDSIVPNKFKVGGWCVHEDTLISMADGKVMKIKDIEELPFVSFDMKDGTSVEARHNHYFKRKAREALKITTLQPRIELTVTPEHRMFVLGKDGINTKPAGELSVGDRLIAAKKISVKGIKIPIPKSLRIRKIPSHVTRELAMLAGYMLGDGHVESSRVTLFDSDASMLRNYKRIAEDILGANCSLRHRKSRNCWQLRIYGSDVSKFFSGFFPEITKSFKKSIPDSIMTLDDEVLSGFLSGLFDAEGYVSSRRVGLTMGREGIIRRLQIMLLRYGIISSIRPVKGRSFAKRQKYALCIDDRKSLERFKDIIGFSSKSKSGLLASAVRERNPMSRIDQVPTDGRYLRSLLNSIRMNSSDFPNVSTNYFRGERQISRDFFVKDIISVVESRLDELHTPVKDAKILKDLLRLEYGEIGRMLGVTKSMAFGNIKYGWNAKAIADALEKERKVLLNKTELVLRELKRIADCDAISVKVGSIESVGPSGLFYDMEVDKYENFIANGLIVHNSANRFARVREGLLEDFLKKVAEIANAQFKGLRDLKGIIVGGPGPIKEQFMEGEHLDYTLRNIVIGTVNTSYTGMPGLQEAVERAEDLMSQAAIVKERQLLERFFGEFSKDSGLAIYGLREVTQALKSGVVEMLIISESFDWEKVSFQCSKCNYREEQLMRKSEALSLKCSKCGANANITEEKSILDELLKLAESAKSSVEHVSIDTPKGEQLKELGGIAAILRYRA